MVVKDMLNAMIDRSASDLHLIDGNPPCFIINGEMRIFDDQPLSRGELTDFFDEVVQDSGRKQKFVTEKELDFAYELEEKARFRFNVYFQRNSVAFSIRMVPLAIPGIDELGLPQETRDITALRSGLVLVIGPAKSGKSTSVASMVDSINHERSTHIITIEDPIEYVYRPDRCIISQREVQEDTNSVADALKHILRQAPGVVVVDGIKDHASVKMVLEAAETGYLVFCTLRSWNVVQSIYKLVHFSPQDERKQVRMQISHTLRAVISQRLMKKADGSGFVCACEILKINPAIQTIIREDKLSHIPMALEDLRREGMITMNEVFLTLLKTGVVDIQEILAQSGSRPGQMESLLLQ